MNLNSLTMTKPDIRYAAVNYRGNHDSEEDEMTQMSCGMNLRETFKVDDSAVNGMQTLNATQGVQNQF